MSLRSGNRKWKQEVQEKTDNDQRKLKHIIDSLDQIDKHIQNLYQRRRGLFG